MASIENASATDRIAGTRATATRSWARRTVTDELLRMVSEVYRQNLTDRWVEAVASAFSTGYRTVARYVQTA